MSKFTLYDRIKSRRGLMALSEMNPELSGKFMAVVRRVMAQAKKKGCPNRDVAIVKPAWNGKSFVFNVHYGKPKG